MQALKIAVRTLCIVPFFTGVADIVDGAGLLTLAGSQLGQAVNDPILNSQIGFWGAIWFWLRRHFVAGQLAPAR